MKKLLSSIGSAIILAGGEGQRLRPLTKDRPKPAVDLNGRPIFAYQLEQMVAVGITEVIFACGYKNRMLEKIAGDGSKFGVKIKYSVEKTPLGRGGAIKKAMGELEQNWENVLITNGDNLWKIDLAGLISQHLSSKALATVVVVPLKSHYGVVDFDSENHVMGFKEKPILPHWVNAGVYVFNKEMEPLLPEIGDHETETFPKLPHEKFFAFPSRDFWRGIDTLKDYADAEKDVEEYFG